MKNILRIFAVMLGLLLPLSSMAQNQRSDDGQSQDQRYGSSQGREGHLSADDQRKFDSYYSRWQDYRRTNNRDEIVSMEKRMLDVYQHYGIPSNTPYERIASGGQRDYRWDRDNNRDRDRDWDRDRDDDRGQWSRLSSDDQRRFDSYYSRWLEYRRTNNRDEITSMEKRMQDVYQHNAIPSNTPYDRVATDGRRY